MTDEENLSSKGSVRFRGVTKRIRDFLWKYPNSKAKEVCRVLDLPYKKYANMVSVEKSQIKRSKGLSMNNYGSKGITNYLLQNPFAKAREICQALNLPYEKHCRSCTHLRWKLIKKGKIPEPKNKFKYDSKCISINTDSFGYILGVLFGDGYVPSSPITSTNRIELGTTNEDFANLFKFHLENWSGRLCKVKNKNETSIFPNGQIYHSKVFRVQLNSKKHLNILQKIIFDFGKLKQLLCIDATKVSFLRGYFDSDGSISSFKDKRKKSYLQCQLRLTDGNKKRLLFAKSLLDYFGIHLYLGKKSEAKCWFLSTCNKPSIWRFKKIIGFSIPYKVQKLEEAPLFYATRQ